MIKNFLDPRQNNELLVKYRGSYATVWLFEVLFTRLGLRLEKPGESEVLYVLGASCKHITGPFSWDNACVSIVLGEEPGEPDVIMDKTAGFELRCGTAGLAVGLAADLDRNLDDPNDPTNPFNQTKEEREKANEAMRKFTAQFDSSKQ